VLQNSQCQRAGIFLRTAVGSKRIGSYVIFLRRALVKFQCQRRSIIAALLGRRMTDEFKNKLWTLEKKAFQLGNGIARLLLS
jgi:hypothetical protein